MMNKHKTILNTIFLIAIFTITIYYVFHGKDMDCLLRYIQNADVRYWSLAVICVILFIVFESIIIFYLMRSIRQKINLVHCFLYSFVGFFFSCITPSASGGQPAQIYYMRKDKIPVPVATLVLMIVTITYKMVLVVIGITVLMIKPKEIMHYLNPVIGICYLGLAINICCVALMVLLVFHPTMAHNILVIIIKILNKIHIIKKPEHFYEKVEHIMRQYKDVANYFRNNQVVVWNVFVISAIQRLLLFYVTYLIYRSFGLSGTGVITIVILQGMIAVAVDMLPLPGGMGISEKLFLVIFTPVFGNIALPGMIMSRGLSYYSELIISAIFTIVAYFVIGRRDERKKIK